MFIVMVEIGKIRTWISSWRCHFDAFREAQSLNEMDVKGYYYVIFREKFYGKNDDIRRCVNAEVSDDWKISRQESNVTRGIPSEAQA